MDSKMKNTFNKDGMNQVLDFVRKNLRYFAAGALLVILILVLVFFMGPKKNDGNAVADTETETVQQEGYEIDAHQEVNDLIASYYTAYAAGDLDALTAVAEPVSDNEKSYITMFSQYVDEYQNFKCYTKKGLDDKSYLVSVYVEIKFAGVDTAAPGLDFFYVRTREDGTLYIDNLYSQYNLVYKENALDTSVQSLINGFEKEADVIALQSEVQTKYDEALKADENLSKMIVTTIPEDIKKWAAAIVQQGTEAPEGTETQPEETEKPEETEQPKEPEDEKPKEDEPQATSEELTATDRVNVRAAADSGSEKLGNVEMGQKVTRTGTEGEWSIIDFEGKKGYIKSEYLTNDPNSITPGNTDSQDGTGGGSVSQGEVVTLKNTVNIRSSMSETADKVGTAYAGEKVTVVMSYAEGWTKVTWNSKSGYVKTSLLQ